MQAIGYNRITLPLFNIARSGVSAKQSFSSLSYAANSATYPSSHERTGIVCADSVGKRETFVGHAGLVRCVSSSSPALYSSSATKMSGNSKLLTSSIREIDTELLDLIKKEKQRQSQGLEMIASENFTSLSVL
uniref:Serine hydroxymethyltransferase-like domain-containing protein n=1 Tax=Musca domestica TaxID=7370 RepID=A0A1I8NIZ1_MUSDO